MCARGCVWVGDGQRPWKILSKGIVSGAFIYISIYRKNWGDKVIGKIVKSSQNYEQDLVIGRNSENK